MTPQSSTSDTTAAQPEPPFVRWLKVAVVAMGIMIVLGVLGVIARIVYMASQGPRPPSAIAGSARLAPGSSLAIPAGHTVRQVSLSGDRLAIHYEGPGGGGIAVVDLATGQVLSRVQLVPEVPK